MSSEVDILKNLFHYKQRYFCHIRAVNDTKMKLPVGEERISFNQVLNTFTRIFSV